MILKKRNKVGRFTRPYLKTSYKVKIIKTLFNMVLKKRQTHRAMEQNREDRNRPHIYD